MTNRSPSRALAWLAALFVLGLAQACLGTPAATAHDEAQTVQREEDDELTDEDPQDPPDGGRP